MKKESILAGLFFGLICGIFQFFVVGLVGGLIVGIVSGVLFSGALYLFVNSGRIKRQTSVDDAELLPGEKILLSKLANLVIKPKDFGLDDFAFDDLLWTVGMKNKESLGGAVHITNFRIIFKSHKFNRMRGKTSIFLPSIQHLSNSSFLLFRKLTLTTASAQVNFVIADVDKVIERIYSAKNQIDSEALESLRSHIVNHPAKCGDGLESWDSLNTVNNLLNLGKKTSDAVKLVANPIGALTSIFMNELIDKTISEKWQKVFESKGHNKSMQPNANASAD